MNQMAQAPGTTHKGDVFLTFQGRISRHNIWKTMLEIVEKSGIRRDHGTSSDGHHPPVPSTFE